MSERELTISALSERITAQTEAYTEFSNALIKIIEVSAAMRDKINENSEFIKDEHNEILRKINELYKDGLLDHNMIESLTEKINSLDNKLTQLSNQESFFYQEIDSNFSNIISKLTVATTEIDRIKSFRVRAKYILSSLAVIVTVVLALDGLGIIKISWFGN